MKIKKRQEKFVIYWGLCNPKVDYLINDLFEAFPQNKCPRMERKEILLWAA